MKIKCWKYLSESFFVFRRTARETPDGVKYNCTTTEKYTQKKKKNGREEERRGETLSMSLARQGEKQREVCDRTALLTRTPANAEQIQLCPPIRLPTSAPLPKERERAGERRRERSQHHEKGKENKAATFAATFHRSSVVVGLAVSPPCLLPLWELAQTLNTITWLRPESGSGTWSKTKRNKQISTYPSLLKSRYQVHLLTQSKSAPNYIKDLTHVLK